MAKTAKTKTSAKSLSFTQIIADIRAGKVAPLYLLSGPEAYFIDRIADLLQQTVVADDAADFDRTVLYGADTDAQQILNEARRFPVMSARQLVVVREAQSMRDARNQLDKLAPFATSPSPASVLAICFKGDSIKGTSALMKSAVKGNAVVFDSQKPKDWQLEKYVQDYCKERRVAIDHSGAALLVSSIGNDLTRLFSEIDKLIISAAGQPVTPELIERNIGISKDFNNFELVAAISRRDYPKASRIIRYFQSNPKTNPTIVTATVLFNFFSNLMLAQFAPDKSERGLMMQLRFHSPYQLTDIGNAMRLYSPASVLRIIHALRVFDCRSKGIGSVEKDYDLLKELIFNIFTL